MLTMAGRNASWGRTVLYAIAAACLLVVGVLGGASAASAHPTNPSGLAATPGYSSITLKWSAPTSASVDHYVIYWREEIGGGGNPYAAVTVGNTANAGYTFTGLYYDSFYEFFVVAYYAGGGQSTATPSVFAQPKNAW